MSLGKHSIANLIGAVIPMLVALVTIPWYLTYIGAERYGILAVVLALVSYFSFFDLGLGRAVTRRISQLTNTSNNEHSDLLWTALIATLLLGMIGSFLLWLSIEYIIKYFIKVSPNYYTEVSDAIFWLLLCLPIILPTTTLIGALQARLRFFEINYAQVISGVLSQTLPLAVAIAGYTKLSHLLAAVLITRLFNLVSMFKYCVKYIPLQGIPTFKLSHLTPMLSYGGWMSVMSLLAPLLVTVDRLVIAAISGARAVTYYTVPYDLVSRATVISSSLHSALFPRLAASSIDEGRKLAQQATCLLLAVITPIIILSLFLINYFLVFWIGADFAYHSQWVAEFILIGVWANSIAIPHHARFMAIENPKIIVFIYLIEIPIYLLFLYIGIYLFGIQGAALAWAFRTAMDTIILLKLNQALYSTFINLALPFLLIICASVAQLNYFNNPYLKVALAVFFVIISIINDKSFWISVLTKVRKYEKPAR